MHRYNSRYVILWHKAILPSIISWAFEVAFPRTFVAIHFIFPESLNLAPKIKSNCGIINMN